MMRRRRPRRVAARGGLVPARGKAFFSLVFGFHIALRMKRTRHQLAPAVPVKKIVDRAVAGLVANRLLIGPLEIVDVQHLASPRSSGKALQQRLLLDERHVLALASARRLRLERFDTAVIVVHLRPVHRTQRNSHCLGDCRLRHPVLTQHHHLDALPLLLRYFPVQRRFQLSNLPLRAFDHPVPSESDGHSESHFIPPQAAPNYRKIPDSISSGSGISRDLK
jgi:hypothetical protein